MPTMCGRCDVVIATGEPMQEIHVGKVKRPLRRCQVCAGGAPPDLPLHIEETRPALREFTRFNLTREPGEDD